MLAIDTLNKIASTLEHNLQLLHADNAAVVALESFWNGYLPVDPVLIAAGYGVPTFRLDASAFSSPEVIAVLQQVDSRPAIILNAQAKKPVQRRAVARALGHHILQNRLYAEETQRTSKAGAEEDALEFQASHFAASLLMPRNIVLFHWKNGLLPDVDAYASQYGIPETLLAYRFRCLGIV